jgi:hypothetical protein
MPNALDRLYEKIIRQSKLPKVAGPFNIETKDRYTLATADTIAEAKRFAGQISRHSGRKIRVFDRHRKRIFDCCPITPA